VFDDKVRGRDDSSEAVEVDGEGAEGQRRRGAGLGWGSYSASLRDRSAAGKGWEEDKNGFAKTFLEPRLYSVQLDDLIGTRNGVDLQHICNRWLFLQIRPFSTRSN